MSPIRPATSTPSANPRSKSRSRVLAGDGRRLTGDGGRVGRLARVSVAVALGREAASRREIRRALRAGDAVEDLREAILQTYLFAGFPRAINGLWMLDELSPGRAGSLPAPHPTGKRRISGVKLCRRIYGAGYGALMARMMRLSPDLAAWILEEGYGKVLCRPRLTPRVRELLVIPTLAAIRAWRQLGPHLKGALNVGAKKSELLDVMAAAGDLLGDRIRRRAMSLVENA